MVNAEFLTPSRAIVSLRLRVPEVGELIQVRSRRWLVEEVVPSKTPGESSVVRLACVDDDAQGQSLDVFWDYALDRQIIKEEGLRLLARFRSQGFIPHGLSRACLAQVADSIPPRALASFTLFSP